MTFSITLLLHVHTSPIVCASCGQTMSPEYLRTEVPSRSTYSSPIWVLLVGNKKVRLALNYMQCMCKENLIPCFWSFNLLTHSKRWLFYRKKAATAVNKNPVFIVDNHLILLYTTIPFRTTSIYRDWHHTTHCNIFISASFAKHLQKELSCSKYVCLVVEEVNCKKVNRWYMLTL